MAENNLSEMGNENFFLTGNKCAFSISEDEEHGRILYVEPVSDNLFYAFGSGSGLCLTTRYGSIQTSDLLGKIISIPDNDVGALVDYFENYGFFFKIPDENGIPLDLMSLMETVNRLKATLTLQSLLGEAKPDYSKLLNVALYLMLSERIKLPIGSRIAYHSCQHHIAKLLDEAMYSLANSSDAQEAAAKGTYSIRDTVYPITYELNADEYEDVTSSNPFMYNYPGIKDSTYRKLMGLYKNAHQESKNSRIVIDFLFHFMQSVGVIESVDYANGIKYYGDPSFDKMDDRMKTALLNVARITLAQEINYNIDRMKPFYSPVSLEGTWKAPNMLVALYFSIFYRRPDMQIYRKCANPTCDNFFTVSATNERKRYCCDNCRNANNQRSHRLKVKKSR